MITLPKELGHIFNVIRRAIHTAKEHNDQVKFTFNDIEMHVYPESFENDIGIIYDLKCYIRRPEAGHKD